MAQLWSKIEITFLREAADGEFMQFRMQSIPNPGTYTPYFREDWQTAPRFGLGQIQVVAQSGTLGAATASQYHTYFLLDYGFNFLFVGQVVSNVVTLWSSSYNFNIYDFSCSSGLATAVITNHTQDTFELVGTPAISAGTSPCNDINVSIETTELAPEVWLNNVQVETTNTNNPYTRDVSRGTPHRFVLLNASASTVTYPLAQANPIYVPKLLAENISINVTPSVSGATVAVSVEDENSIYVPNPDLTLDYSLNGTDWQSSNIFTGQAEGNYTMYVKDQFGCQVTKNYSVAGYGTRDPFLFISHANSIPFHEHEEIDNQTIYPGDHNLLAYQSLNDVQYCEEILFTNQDIITIQFKSNYDTPTVTLRKEDGNTWSIPTVQRTSNLGRFLSMDCMMYKYADGLTGLYFETGNTYDEADIVNGTYTLNGNLPDFAIIGQLIFVDGIGVFEISDVLFDSTINKKVIVFEYSYTGSPVAKIVDSIYDLLPYEIYEFTIDWSTYGNGLYDVLIDNTDTNNGTVQHLSENILIADEHTGTVAIRYFNDNNRDIFYKFGIEHFIRIPYIDIQANITDNVDVNITDLSAYLVESSLDDGNIFIFDHLTRQTMLRTSIALSCENLFLNNVGYLKQQSLEIEQIEKTNLYQITATLVKTNENYNINRQGQEGVEDGALDFNIPAFVGTGVGFIKR